MVGKYPLASTTQAGGIVWGNVHVSHQTGARWSTAGTPSNRTTWPHLNNYTARVNRHIVGIELMILTERTSWHQSNARITGSIPSHAIDK